MGRQPAAKAVCSGDGNPRLGGHLLAKQSAAFSNLGKSELAQHQQLRKASECFPVASFVGGDFAIVSSVVFHAAIRAAHRPPAARMA